MYEFFWNAIIWLISTTIIIIGTVKTNSATCYVIHTLVISSIINAIENTPAYVLPTKVIANIPSPSPLLLIPDFDISTLLVPRCICVKSSIVNVVWKWFNYANIWTRNLPWWQILEFLFSICKLALPRLWGSRPFLLNLGMGQHETT